jgi:hypothetical protein
MSKKPLVANLVANLSQSDIVKLAGHVSAIMNPKASNRRKRNVVKGLFKHSRSGLWYWRFTHQGRRFVLPLKTSDALVAQAAALREMAALAGTPERKTTPEEKAAYVASIQSTKNVKSLWAKTVTAQGRRGLIPSVNNQSSVTVPSS